jgi:hypothetical protein
MSWRKTSRQTTRTDSRDTTFPGSPTSRLCARFNENLTMRYGEDVRVLYNTFFIFVCCPWTMYRWKVDLFSLLAQCKDFEPFLFYFFFSCPVRIKQMSERYSDTSCKNSVNNERSFVIWNCFTLLL